MVMANRLNCLICVLAHTLSLVCGTDYYFYITTSSGTLCPEEVANQNRNHTCLTISEYAQGMYRYEKSDNVFLELESGAHVLDTGVRFSSNKTSILANSKAAISCTGERIQNIISLRQINSVLIQNVEFFPRCRIIITMVTNLLLDGMAFYLNQTHGVRLNRIGKGTISNSTFVERDGCGGGFPSHYIWADLVDSLLVSRCTFQNNSGGCIYTEDCHLTVEHSTFEQSVNGCNFPNDGSSTQTGVRLGNRGGTITLSHLGNDIAGSDSLNITNSSFVGGQALFGGAVYVRGSDTPVWISESTFENNSATRQRRDRGDAVYIFTESSVVLSNNMFKPDTEQTVSIFGTDNVTFVTTPTEVITTTSIPITDLNNSTMEPLTTDASTSSTTEILTTSTGTPSTDAVNSTTEALTTDPSTDAVNSTTEALTMSTLSTDAVNSTTEALTTSTPSTNAVNSTTKALTMSTLSTDAVNSTTEALTTSTSSTDAVNSTTEALTIDPSTDAVNSTTEALTTSTPSTDAVNSTTETLTTDPSTDVTNSTTETLITSAPSTDAVNSTTEALTTAPSTDAVNSTMEALTTAPSTDAVNSTMEALTMSIPSISTTEDLITASIANNSNSGGTSSIVLDGTKMLTIILIMVVFSLLH